MRKAWFVHAQWLRTISPVLLLAVAVGNAGADSGPWQRVSPAPSTPFSDMLWDGHQLVAVSGEGMVETSPDGIDWTEQPTALPHAAGIAWNGTTYVVVSDANAIWTSSDATTWRFAPESSSLSGGLYAVTWSGSAFVATGRGQAATSPNGTTWTVAQLGAAFLGSVASDGQTLVAVGWGWIGQDAVARAWRSSDGLAWTQVDVPPVGLLRKVVWAGSRFVAVSESGDVITSPDGTTWVLASRVPGLGWGDLIWNGSLVLALGGTNPATSPDGVTWTWQGTGDPANPVAGASPGAWTGQGFLVGGTWEVSPDGRGWANHAIDVAALSGGGERTIAVGKRGQVLTSHDEGATWLRRAAPTTADLFWVGWTGSGFLAFAADRTTVASTDGSTWQAPRPTGLDTAVVKATWSGARWVAVLADGSLAASSDGGSFARTAVLERKVVDVCTTGRELVAVGGAGLVMTSRDGLTWESRDAGTTADLTGVIWTGSELVAVGAGPSVLSSPDGVHWAPAAVPQPAFPQGPNHSPMEKLGSVSFDGTAVLTWGGYSLWGGPVSAGTTEFFARSSPGAWAPAVLPTELVDYALVVPERQRLVRTQGHVILAQGNRIWRMPRLPRRAVVPTAAHVGGLNGTFWRTDLDVVNRGSEPARYSVELLPRPGTPVRPPAAFTLQPGGAASHIDLLETAFGVSGAGALRVTTLTGQVQCFSRTYSDTGAGSLGQSVAAIGEEKAIRAGAVGRLVGLSQAAGRADGYRTNIGVVNTSSVSITVEVELHAASGALLGTVTETVPPGALKQLDEVFRRVTGAPVSGGYALARTSTVGGAFLAYASVIDNRTGDPVLHEAR